MTAPNLKLFTPLFDMLDPFCPFWCSFSNLGLSAPYKIRISLEPFDIIKEKLSKILDLSARSGWVHAEGAGGSVSAGRGDRCRRAWCTTPLHWICTMHQVCMHLANYALPELGQKENKMPSTTTKGEQDIKKKLWTSQTGS